MKKLVLFLSLLLAATIWSCEKHEINNNEPDPTAPTSLDELNVPTSFDWSTSISNTLTVTLSHSPDVSVEGQVLLLIGNNNIVLSKSIIKNDQAMFNIKIPTDVGELYLFYPNTANKQKLDFTSNSKGGTTMNVDPQPRTATKSNGLNYDLKLAEKYFNKYMNKIPNNAKGVNLVQNPYFDQNNLAHDGRSWTKQRTPGKWYYTNSNSTAVTTNINGNMVFKNTKSGYDVLQQSFPVSGGSTYNFSLVFSGNINLWLDNFNANGQWIGETHVVTSGNKITSSGTILPNATSFQFYIGLNSGAWVDSVIYTSTNVVADSDGDGINDVWNIKNLNLEFKYDKDIKPNLSHPLKYWTCLDIWLYILKRNLPINPLYKLGWERSVCWLCPGQSVIQAELVKRYGGDTIGRKIK